MAQHKLSIHVAFLSTGSSSSSSYAYIYIIHTYIQQGSEEDSPQSFLACDVLNEAEINRVKGSIAMVLRGQCSFVTKARNIQVRRRPNQLRQADLTGCMLTYLPAYPMVSKRMLVQ